MWSLSVPPDVLGRAYEFLIKQFADDAGAKAGEFFTPPEVVDALVRMLEPKPADKKKDKLKKEIFGKEGTRARSTA